MNKKQLQNALQLATQVSNVVEFSEGKLRATDNENTIIIKLDNEHKFVVDGKKLLNTIKAIKDDEINITTDAKIEVKSSVGKYKFPLLIETLPSTPKTPESTQTFPTQYIPKLHNFIGTDNLRPTLASLYISDGELVATDSHLLSRVKCDVSGNIMLSRKSITLVNNIFESEVKFGFDNTNAYFTNEAVELYSRLTDGNYPNYKAVIPTTNTNNFTFNRNKLLECINRISSLGNQTIKFTFGENIIIETHDIDFQTSAKELFLGEYSGENMEIGFNAKLFSIIIRNFDEDTLTLSMGLNNKPAIMENENMLNLIMPVLV